METITKKDGSKTYREKVYVNGRAVAQSFARRTDAAAWKRRMVSERDRNEALGIAPKKEIAFGAFLDLWWGRKFGDWTASTQVRYEGLLRMYVRPALASRVLHHIGREAISDMVSQFRSQQVTAPTIDRVIELLKAVFGDALAWEYIAVNPAARMPKMAIRVSRKEFWDEREAEQFLAAIAGDPLFPLYSFALKSGMRKGEMAALRWSAVNFATNIVSVCRTRGRYGERETTKTRQSREIPMNADMRRVLGGLQKTRQESWQYVFCDASGQPLNLHHIVRPFRSAQRRAGMAKSIDFHCLRHCFASHFLMRGGSLGAGAVILGHTTTEMTDRYGHIAKNHVAYEMAKMSGPGRKVEALSPELAHDGTS